MKVYTTKTIKTTNYPQALDFVWQVFQKFEAPVYHKLGFHDVDVEQTLKGVKFTPMVYNAYNNQVKEEHT